ncbi:MAG: hypothetical protein CVT64_01115 [Actinobacteria bacterium HGW-Actinobacteria-4]|nr:MAG: hypothetical protein CVT64_01115 [Actinobacteria bacterium HGW-Actinobacteria-4]
MGGAGTVLERTIVVLVAIPVALGMIGEIYHAHRIAHAENAFDVFGFREYRSGIIWHSYVDDHEPIEGDLVLSVAEIDAMLDNSRHAVDGLVARREWRALFTNPLTGESAGQWGFRELPTSRYGDPLPSSILTSGRFPEASGEVALGVGYARDIGVDIGSPVEITSEDGTGSHTVTVVGIVGESTTWMLTGDYSLWEERPAPPAVFAWEDSTVLTEVAPFPSYGATTAFWNGDGSTLGPLATYSERFLRQDRFGAWPLFDSGAWYFVRGAIIAVMGAGVVLLLRGRGLHDQTKASHRAPRIVAAGAIGTGVGTLAAIAISALTRFSFDIYMASAPASVLGIPAVGRLTAWLIAGVTLGVLYWALASVRGSRLTTNAITQHALPRLLARAIRALVFPSRWMLFVLVVIAAVAVGLLTLDQPASERYGRHLDFGQEPVPWETFALNAALLASVLALLAGTAAWLTGSVGRLRDGTIDVGYARSRWDSRAAWLAVAVAGGWTLWLAIPLIAYAARSGYLGYPLEYSGSALGLLSGCAGVAYAARWVSHRSSEPPPDTAPRASRTSAFMVGGWLAARVAILGVASSIVLVAIMIILYGGGEAAWPAQSPSPITVEWIIAVIAAASVPAFATVAAASAGTLIGATIAAWPERQNLDHDPLVLPESTTEQETARTLA